MSYALSFSEPVAQAVDAVRREQLAAAAEEVRARDVHEARKRLKKTRALLRLARPAIKPKAFRAHNRALRDAGRAMSGARDAEVMVETVDDLAERFPRQAKFAAVRRRLATRVDEAPPGAELPSAPWPLDGLTPEHLPQALKRTYARGRDAFKLADRDPTAEHLHAWRKRVKDLWYQERLLEETWPGVLKAQAKEAKKLSKILGEDHDLAVLSALLREDAKLAALSGDLQELIAERRAVLLARARGLGRRVYAERPKHFARRLGRYVALA
jgi:CHAD domain-containing protein